MLRIGLLTRGHNIDQGYRWVTEEPLYQPWKEYVDKGLLNTDGVSAMAWQSGGRWGVLLCGVPTLRPMWLGDICTCMLSLQGVGTSAEYREITLSIKILELWLADIAADPFNLRLDRIVSPQASVLGRHMHKTISAERAQKLFTLPRNKSEHLWQNEVEHFLKSLERKYAHNIPDFHASHMTPFHSTLALSPRTWYQGAIMSFENRAIFIEQVHHLLHAGTHGVALFCNGADPGSLVDKARIQNTSGFNGTASTSSISSTPGRESTRMGNDGYLSLVAVLTNSPVSNSAQSLLRPYSHGNSFQEISGSSRVLDVPTVHTVEDMSSASSVLSGTEYSTLYLSEVQLESVASDSTSESLPSTAQCSPELRARSTRTISALLRLPWIIQTREPSEGFVTDLWNQLHRLARSIGEYVARHLR